MFGFFRVAAAVPEVRVADVGFNTDHIIDQIRLAAKESVGAIVFPALSITGATCGDLFYQRRLLDWAERSLLKIALSVKDRHQLIIVGLPLRYNNALYDVAAVLQDGKVVGLVPKSVITGSRECGNVRYFASGAGIRRSTYLLTGQDAPIPFGTDLLFSAGNDFKFAIELGEDFWIPRPPSSLLSEAGARLIFNLSCSPEMVGKADFRINLLAAHSARCFSAYVYSSCGVGESTTSSVCGGHAVIADNGKIVRESARFNRSSAMIMSDIDMERLAAIRRTDGLFADVHESEYRVVNLNSLNGSPDLLHADLTAEPFVPHDADERDANCAEVLAIQASALARRIDHIQARRVIIGVSGGWDSTLALLVASQSMLMLGRPVSDIMAVTLPGFATSETTYNNSVELCRALGVELIEISIKEACMLHLEAIGHDFNHHNVVYENVQARQRTHFLMSLANQEAGLVLGTGDLSEIALGWSTFNGDHMAMYNVNCSVPKTLIPHLMEYFCRSASEELRGAVSRIAETPASPELVPAAAGSASAPGTEERIGPYRLHDFYLYHFIRYGATPEKIRYLAEHVFHKEFSGETLTDTLNTFLSRFFANQYKRNCAPDGPRLGTVGLSSHGTWMMPSDASDKCWLSTEAPSGARAGGRNRTDWTEYSKKADKDA